MRRRIKIKIKTNDGEEEVIQEIRLRDEELLKISQKFKHKIEQTGKEKEQQKSKKVVVVNELKEYYEDEEYYEDNNPEDEE